MELFPLEWWGWICSITCAILDSLLIILGNSHSKKYTAKNIFRRQCSAENVWVWSNNWFPLSLTELIINRLWAFLISVVKRGWRRNLKFIFYPDQVSPDNSLWRLTTGFAFIIFICEMVHVWQWIVSLIACFPSSCQSLPKNKFEICHPFLVKVQPKIFSKSGQNTFFQCMETILFWPFRGSSAQNIIWSQ